MKIIEAMKKVKANREKITDLQEKIGNNCANLDIETPAYDDPKGKIKAWAQSCLDLSQESVRLLTAISRTNLETQVSIEIGGKIVTKSIAEWIWRRREFAKLDQLTFNKMTDRGLREGQINSSTGITREVKIVRHYDIEHRDRMVGAFREEPGLIDSTLEVINATTDLIE